MITSFKVAFMPSLPSLGKKKLCCDSDHNTVSIASASDWFTASLTHSTHSGRLDLFTNDWFCHRYTICGWLIFINEFQWKAASIQRNEPDLMMWGRRFIATNKPCQLFCSTRYFSDRQKPAGYCSAVIIIPHWGEKKIWKSEGLLQSQAGLLSWWRNNSYCNVKTKQ